MNPILRQEFRDLLRAKGDFVPVFIVFVFHVDEMNIIERWTCDTLAAAW